MLFYFLSDSIDKILTGGIFDDTKYASVYGMLQKDSDLNIPLSVVVSIQTLYMLAATTDIFGKKVTNFTELKNIDYGIFVAKLLFQHIGIVRTNSIKVFIGYLLIYDSRNRNICYDISFYFLQFTICSIILLKMILDEAK